MYAAALEHLCPFLFFEWKIVDCQKPAPSLLPVLKSFLILIWEFAQASKYALEIGLGAFWFDTSRGPPLPWNFDGPFSLFSAFLKKGNTSFHAQPSFPKFAHSS